MVASPGGLPENVLAPELRAALALELVIVEDLGANEDRNVAAIRAAARYLDTKRPRRIGVGWGLTLRSLPKAVTTRPDRQVEVIEIIGGAEWWAPDDGPFSVSSALAGRYGGRGWALPAPAFAESTEVARAYLDAPAVGDLLAKATSADVILVGPSTADPETSSLVLAGGLTRAEMLALRARGAVGDIVGQFYDGDGRPIATELDSRSVRLSLEQLRAANVVAIATGTVRVRSIIGAVRCRLLKGLITDEQTARELIEGSRRNRP